MRGVVVVLAWGSWRAAMCAWCGGGRLGLIGGVLGPFLRTLTRQVAVWARRPHCHLKGPAAQRRASTTTCGAQLRGAGWASYGQPVADLSGAQLRRRGGIATIGGSGRRVVGVSRAYGRNSPRLELCRRRGSFDHEAQQSQFPRLEPGRHHLSGRHAPMRRRPVGARAPHIVTFLKPCQYTLRNGLIVPVLECVLCCFVVDGQRTSRPRQYNY